jgi:hypothetical protein
MGYRLAADAVVVLHLLFIVFVMFGGILALRWKWLIALHVPAVVWGMSVEFFHLYSPLTPLENLLRAKAGEGGYAGGFVEHYLIALIYPVGLTPAIQVWLGASVLLVNLLVYGVLFRRCRRGGKSG